MDLEVHLARIERVIAEARTLPLSASVMINRSEIEDLLRELRSAIPNEVRQARWIIKERDDLLAVAEREAEQTRNDGLAEQERMVSETEVVRAAGREAERILEDAREQARTLRLQADDYVDGKLAGFEGILERTLSAVSRGRDQLQTRTVGAGNEPASSGDEGGDTGEHLEPPIQLYDQERTDP
ncbi:MAG: hypothetical protein GEU81_08605 [Nitriliruptorales bacterium]|nr:hypothetical protein [Nitriliruptorales bacterium]